MYLGVLYLIDDKLYWNVEVRAFGIHISTVQSGVIMSLGSNQPIERLFDKWESKGNILSRQFATVISNESQTLTYNSLCLRSAEATSPTTL